MQFSTIQPIKPMSFAETGESMKNETSKVSFSEMLSDAVSEYARLQQTADADSVALSLGNVDDLAQIQINAMKAEAALQTTVQLTSRVVSAYKEIMQMNI